MYIVSRAEIKRILQITDSSKDELIDALLPIVEDFILDYTGNAFTGLEVRSVNNTFAFVAGTPATITDSAEGFVDAGFVDGIEVFVEGTFFNDGYYLIDTVAAGTLTLATGEILANETPSTSRPVYILAAKIPEAIKVAAAQMINTEIQKSSSSPLEIASEKIGNYSVSYKAGESNKSGYPESVIGTLNLFKKIKSRRS